MYPKLNQSVDLIKRFEYSLETTLFARNTTPTEIGKEFYRNKIEAYNSMLAIIKHECVSENCSVGEQPIEEGAIFNTAD